MILQPSWKLLNKHLPIFTEVQGYGMPLQQVTLPSSETPSASKEAASGNAESDLRGFESDEDDEIEEPCGIKGMTLQLVELLTTLV